MLVEVSHEEVPRTGERANSFFKSIKDSTMHVKGGKNYTIWDEYEALVRLWEASKEFFPEPYDPLEMEGVIVGYQMEKIDGVPVKGVLNSWYESGFDESKMIDQLNEMSMELTRNDETHGDIHPSNVLVYGEGDIKAIDPVGYSYIFPEEIEKSKEGVMKEDIDAVKEIIQDIENM